MANEIDVFIEATEQLKALKETVIKQQDTGLKLQGVYDSFIRIADEVGKLPKGLSIILDKAETAEKQMKTSSDKVDALSNSIPEIVSRIEHSDFWKSAAALTTELKSNRDELEKFREVARQFNGVLNAHFESQAQWRQDVMSTLQVQTGGIAEIKNILSSRLENLTENQDRLGQNMIAAQNQQTKNIAWIMQAVSAIQDKQISSSTDLSNTINSSKKDYGAVLEKVSTAFGKIAESTNQTNVSLRQVRDQEIGILIKIDEGMTEQNKVLKKIEAKKVSIF
jgi:hypothetical protein